MAPGPANHAAPSAIPAAAPPADDDADLRVRQVADRRHVLPVAGARRAVRSSRSAIAWTQGKVLCIIEAMKLMNEIESEYAGDRQRSYVENGQPVQYGERLFAIRTR